jgi:hypothetical protein
MLRDQLVLPKYISYFRTLIKYKPMLGGQLVLPKYICELRTHDFTKYKPMLGG